MRIRREILTKENFVQKVWILYTVHLVDSKDLHILQGSGFVIRIRVRMDPHYVDLLYPECVDGTKKLLFVHFFMF